MTQEQDFDLLISCDQCGLKIRLGSARFLYANGGSDSYPAIVHSLERVCGDCYNLALYDLRQAIKKAGEKEKENMLAVKCEVCQKPIHDRRPYILSDYNEASEELEDNAVINIDEIDEER